MKNSGLNQFQSLCFEEKKKNVGMQRSFYQHTDCGADESDGGCGARRFLRADHRTGLSIVLIVSR